MVADTTDYGVKRTRPASRQPSPPCTSPPCERTQTHRVSKPPPPPPAAPSLYRRFLIQKLEYTANLSHPISTTVLIYCKRCKRFLLLHRVHWRTHTHTHLPPIVYMHIYDGLTPMRPSFDSSRLLWLTWQISKCSFFSDIRPLDVPLSPPRFSFFFSSSCGLEWKRTYCSG